MKQINRTNNIGKRGKAIHKLLLTATAVFLLFGTTANVAAMTDFSGSLNSVSITNSSGTNSPPTANFTYTQDGDTIFFDARGSSDVDGNITKYNWDFGDGKITNGTTATYTIIDAAILKVTLIVVDNNNGTTLTQKTILTSTKSIADDFSTDTAGDYSILAGGLKVYNGTAQTSEVWIPTYAIHKTALTSSNHWVEAEVSTDGKNGTGGLLFRVNRTQNTGYLASFANGNIVLTSYSSGTKNWIASFSGNFTAGTYHLRAEISGNVIKLYVEETLVLQKTDNSFTTGDSAGLYITTPANIDNFTGEQL